MSRVKSQFDGARRPLAVGIWSFLVMLMPLTRAHVSSELSVWVLILVSAMCAAAILIVGDNQSDGQSNPGFRRHIPIAISILITVLWAVFLSEKSRPFDSTGAAIMGLFPVVLAAIWSTSRLGPHAKVIPASDPQAKTTHRFETANEVTAKRTVEAIGEAASTVPFSQAPFSILDEFSDESDHDSSDFAHSDDVTHWLKRSRTVDGEIIEGGLRVEFADGQRDVTVHISFCPPFKSVPAIEAEDLEGDGFEIRVAASFPFGARLTVRRPAVSKSDHSVNSTRTSRIGFVAIASVDGRRIA